MSLPRLFTVPEAASALTVSPAWVYEHQRELGAVKIGRAVRIPEPGIDDYLQRHVILDERGRRRYISRSEIRRKDAALMRLVRGGKTETREAVRTLELERLGLKRGKA